MSNTATTPRSRRERINRPVPWADLTEGQRDFQSTKMTIHAAMVDRMDREIGRVLDQIRTMGCWDNTLTFFLSDNGASAEGGPQGLFNDVAWMNGIQFFLYRPATIVQGHCLLVDSPWSLTAISQAQFWHGNCPKRPRLCGRATSVSSAAN